MTKGLYTELQIETHADVADILAAALADMVGGVEIRDAQTIFPTAPDRAAVVAVFLPDQRDEVVAVAMDTLETARQGGAAVDPVTWRERSAHEDEWRDVWKQFFRTTRIGKRFVVKPSWEEGPAPPATFVVHLDPGRAFGTGAHPSTRLVIANMERLFESGTRPQTVLDLGCGSGILTIAARRLWPEAKMLAVDIDAESVECSQENFERNDLHDIARAVGSLDVVSSRHALVLANIQADVLEKLADQFPARIEPGGDLLLSGILVEQGDMVVSAFAAHGFSCVHREVDGEWTSLHLRAARQ